LAVRRSAILTTNRVLLSRSKAKDGKRPVDLHAVKVKKANQQHSLFKRVNEARVLGSHTLPASLAALVKAKSAGAKKPPVAKGTKPGAAKPAGIPAAAAKPAAAAAKPAAKPADKPAAAAAAGKKAPAPKEK